MAIADMRKDYGCEGRLEQGLAREAVRRVKEWQAKAGAAPPHAPEAMGRNTAIASRVAMEESRRLRCRREADGVWFIEHMAF